MAVAQRGGVDIVLNDVSKLQTPNVVCYGEERRLIGEAGATAAARNLRNTLQYSVTRFLGKQVEEEACKAAAARVRPLRVEPAPEASERPAFCVEGPRNREDGERPALQLEPEQAAGALLAQFRRQVEAEYPEQKVRDVVITVPQYANDAYRRALLDAAEIADLNVLRLIASTTATALSYGIYKAKSLPEKEEDGVLVLFVDIGYASTEAALVRFTSTKLKVLGQASNPNLGGRDLDEVLFNHFRAEFDQKYKMDIASSTRACARLREGCEKLKKVLSGTPVGQISIDCLLDDKDVRGTMKREEFEALAADTLNAFVKPALDALAAAGMTTADLTTVEVTGSGSRMLTVQKRLEDALGKPMSMTTNAEESAARGAALACAIASPIVRVRDFTVEECLLYPVEVEYPAEDGSGKLEKIALFDRYSVIPSTKQLALTLADGFDFRVIYGQGSKAEASAYDTLASGKVPALSPVKVDGADVELQSQKVKIKVKVNEYGLVEVLGAESSQSYEIEVEEKVPKKKEEGAEKMDTTADGEKKEGEEEAAPAAAAEPEFEVTKVTKKKTHKVALSVPVTYPAALPVERLTRYVEVEHAAAAADKLVQDTAKARNDVEEYVYSLRDKLSYQYKDFASEETIASIQPVLRETEDWLYGDGENQTKSVYTDKLVALRALGDPIHARYTEAEERPSTIKEFESVCVAFEVKATTQLDEYDHISAEDKAKVVEAVKEARSWLAEKMAEVDRSPKSADPPVTVAEIAARAKVLQALGGAIMNQPKPKPAPKAEEPKAEEGKEEKAAEGDADDGAKDEPMADEPEEKKAKVDEEAS
jgi:heat shock protein 4